MCQEYWTNKKLAAVSEYLSFSTFRRSKNVDHSNETIRDLFPFTFHRSSILSYIFSFFFFFFLQKRRQSDTRSFSEWKRPGGFGNIVSNFPAFRSKITAYVIGHRTRLPGDSVLVTSYGVLIIAEWREEELNRKIATMCTRPSFARGNYSIA